MRENLRKAGLAGAAVFAVLFFVVIFKIGPIMSIDKSITSLFGGFQSSFGDAIMFFIEQLGGPYMGMFYALSLAVILWMSELKIPAVWVLATYLSGTVVLGTLVKTIVGRQRPIGHQSYDTGFSFPSGHMLVVSIIITMLFVLVIPNMTNNNLRQWASWGVITFGLLVAESRLYWQAHFITDIIAGVGLGVAWVILWVWLYQRYAAQLRRISFFENEDV